MNDRMFTGLSNGQGTGGSARRRTSGTRRRLNVVYDQRSNAVTACFTGQRNQMREAAITRLIFNRYPPVGRQPRRFKTKHILVVVIEYVFDTDNEVEVRADAISTGQTDDEIIIGTDGRKTNWIKVIALANISAA